MTTAMLAGNRKPATDRQRFERAISRLWGLGIVALGPVDAPPERAHVALSERVAGRFPDGMGSYLFWTAADASGFDQHGRLSRALTLHCSSGEVVRTAVAVLQDCGVDAAAPPAPATVVVFPSETGREGG